MGLVERQCKGSSNKARLNFLRAEDIRWVRAEPSTIQDEKVGKRGDNKAGKRGQDKAGTREHTNAGTRRQNKVGIGGEIKVGIGRWNVTSTERWDELGIGGRDDKTSIRRQDDEEAVEPAASPCYIWIRRLLHCAFLLAAQFNHFLAFSSSEFVIGWLLSSGSITNFGSLVLSTNRGAPFLR